MLEFLTLGLLALEPPGQVIGFYSNGRLAQATALGRDGKGYVHLFQHRERYYGSEGLVRILEAAAAALADAYPGGERLQIGDLSAEKGGRITRHASHQNGLDADIVYFRNDRREQDGGPIQDEFDESFVVDGELSENFDIVRNWALAKTFVASGRVNRMFVDAVIKQALCAHAKETGELESQAETLRRLRPYPSHDDHIHLRLTCPEGSPRCVEQENVPESTECP
jgi:penicillin-insensitive murein endopeptidase